MGTAARQLHQTCAVPWKGLEVIGSLVADLTSTAASDSLKIIFNNCQIKQI